MKIVNLAITATVAVILLGALLVPTITDAVDDNTLTESNYGIPVGTPDRWSAEFAMSDGAATATVNGASVNVSETAPMYVSNHASIIFNEAALILYYYDAETGTGKNISGPATLSISVSGNSTTISAVKSGTTTNLTYTEAWAYMYDASGAFVSKYIPNENTTIYFNDVSQLHGSFQTLNSSPTAYYAFAGDKVTVNGSNTVTATIDSNDTDSKTVHYGVFNRNASTCDYTFEWNGATEYPLIVVAPHIVTGALDNGLGAGTIAILLTVPVMMIAAILVMVVRHGVA